MSRNIRILPDYADLSSVPSQTAHDEYDILILPGGAPGAKTFCSTPAVLDLVTKFRKAGKWVAAICAATTALVAADKYATESEKSGDDAVGLGKKKATSHPSVRDEVEKAGWEYSEERVVVDGRVITSRGPGTAMGFSLRIVEKICGKGKRGRSRGRWLLRGFRRDGDGGGC